MEASGSPVASAEQKAVITGNSGRCAEHEHGCFRRCSWWREQFCAGADASAINVVTTELRDTLDLCAQAPTLRLKPSP